MTATAEPGLNPQKIRLAFLVLSTASVIWVLIFATGTTFASVGGLALVFVPILLWVILGLEYLGFVVRTRTAPGRLATPSGLEALIAEPRKEELDTLVSPVGANGLSDFAAWLFLRAVLEPKGFYERISERVELGHVSLVRRVSYSCDVLAFKREGHPSDRSVRIMRQLAVPDSGASLVVPLERVRRGTLGGGLRVYDEAGKSASTVSSYDLAILQLAVFRSVVKRLKGLSLPKYIDDVEPLVSEAVRRRMPPTEEQRKAVTEALTEYSKGADGHRVLLVLLDALLDWYPICVAVSKKKVEDMKWPETLRFTVERRSGSDLRDPVADEDEGDGVLRKLDGLRLLLGVPINRVYASVSEADRTRSYHLEVCGPPGTYVARQAFLAVPPANAEDLSVEAFVSPRRGQRRARTLITDVKRNSKSALSARLVFAVKFFERAPGSFGITTIASSLLTLATCLLLLASVAGQDVPQTVAGVLLTLPAASVALSGLDSRREFRQSSLLSMGLNASLLLTVGLSLFVVLLPMEQETATFLWRIALALSAMTLVVSLCTWVTRMTTERRLRSGVDEPEDSWEFRASMSGEH